MQTDIDEVVHVKFKGTMAELLVKLNPNKYEKFKEMENGTMALYIVLKRHSMECLELHCFSGRN